jgi:hypothetical protein
MIHRGVIKGAALAATTGLAAVAITPQVVDAAALPTKSGYYAANTHVKSADVEFHLHANGTRTFDLALVCFPKNPAWTEGSGEAQIEVKAPLLKVQGGRLSFHGSAVVAPVDGKRVTTANFNLSLHRVDTPVIHFKNTLGAMDTETGAWKGTATSPACRSNVNGGKVTLFGPVAGE